MKKLFVLLLIAGCIWSCQTPNSEMESLRTELSSVQKELDALKNERTRSTSVLVHTVFLSLKEDIKNEDKETVIQKLSSLGEIEEVLSIQISDRIDVGDTRALDYDLVLYMTFQNEADLSAYDQNAYHNEVRAFLKPFLGGPPATFDYMVQ